MVIRALGHKNGQETVTWNADRKQLIKVLLVALVLGILAGAIAAGRLRFLVSW